MQLLSEDLKRAILRINHNRRLNEVIRTKVLLCEKGKREKWESSVGQCVIRHSESSIVSYLTRQLLWAE